MMKYILLFLFILTHVSSKEISSFEGILIYKKEYLIKKGSNISLDKLYSSRGDLAIKIIKRNNYKWTVEYKGGKTGEYIYKGDENKNYNIRADGHFSVSDYSINRSPLLRKKIIRTAPILCM